MNIDMKNDINQLLQKQYNDLLNGVYTVNSNLLNTRALDILKSLKFDSYDICAMDLIIKISNVLYNSTSVEVLPLEDGIYDQCMVWAIRNIPNYQVGSKEVFDIKIDNAPTIVEKPKYGFTVLEDINECSKDPEMYYENYWFTDDLRKLYTSEFSKINGGFYALDDKGKSYRDTSHIYPELVGTLDKYKFVLNDDAIKRGVFEDPNVSILERDFFGPHIQAGILDPNRCICMTLELKMDGISIEAEVCGDEILSARTRGDTNNDEATDLTHIFKGWKFFNASGVSKNEKFGMKFECMISNLDLSRLSRDRDKYYKNPRNTISGIIGSNEAKRWLPYMTLIPLETSISNKIDRDDELKFMNTYYATEPLRYVTIIGTYVEILYQIKKFCEEAEYIRPIMPYIYDGIVVRYMDKDIIKALGRQNYVNKWCGAVKFNAQRKNTIFLGYTYSVGQDGVITPIAHYNPVELFGNTHSKTTVHSYKRFNELNLKKGDVVSIELVNDVIPYISKPDVSDNEYNSLVEPEQFPIVCPECGEQLVVSQSGKSIMCPNMECPGRAISRVTNMLSKIGVKDFSEATVRLLRDKVYNLSSFINVANNHEFVRSKLGPVETENLYMQINRILTEPIEDYRAVGSIGFTGIAQSTWKSILKDITLEEIIHLPDEELHKRLIFINGIGKVKVNVIITERHLSYIDEDLNFICSMKNVIRSFGQSFIEGIQIRFSGIRDKDLIKELSEKGYDISDGSITKNTNILVIPYKGYSSTKTRSVSDDCKVVTIDEFRVMKALL